MSEKYCDQHNHQLRSFYKKLLGFLLGLFIIILFTVFLIWIILRPSRPRIILQDATIANFNLVSTPLNYLNATIQVTILCHNPNDHIVILFEKMGVHATYKHQQITMQTAVPTGYLAPNDDTVWSPNLYSMNSPIAPYLAAQLAVEQKMKMVTLEIKLNGKIKWKVGSWMSGDYHLYAACPAYVAIGSGQAGEGMKFQLGVVCAVEVGLGV